MDKSDNNQTVRNIGQKVQKKRGWYRWWWLGGGGGVVLKNKTTENCFLVSFSKFITVVSNGKKERKVTLKRRAP